MTFFSKPVNVLLGLLFLVPTAFAQTPTAPDAQTIAKVQRLERRLAVAERQVRREATARQELKTATAVTNHRLTEAVAAIGQQAVQLSQLKQGQADLGIRVGDEAARLRTDDEKLQAFINYRSRAFAGILGGVLLLGLLGHVVWRRVMARRFAAIDIRLDDVANSARDSEARAALTDATLADRLHALLVEFKQRAPAPVDAATEPDHHLPAKVADEIHRMRKRLQSLPEETRGLTPLKKSLERLEGELSNYGYEIVDHTGRPFSENLSVKARFIPTDDLAANERVISKVVVPQLNHRGVMVRMADVEVSIGS